MTDVHFNENLTYFNPNNSPNTCNVILPEKGSFIVLTLLRTIAEDPSLSAEALSFFVEYKMKDKHIHQRKTRLAFTSFQP